MAEPFTGTHWEKGYDEEVLDGWTDSSSDDEVSTIGSDEEIVTPALERTVGREVQRREAAARVKEGEARLAKAKEALKGLEESYWRSGGTALENMREGLFGWRELNIGEISGQFP